MSGLELETFGTESLSSCDFPLGASCGSGSALLSSISAMLITRRGTHVCYAGREAAVPSQCKSHAAICALVTLLECACSSESGPASGQKFLIKESLKTEQLH